MTIYRYAYDRSGRTFTEQEWIGRAIPHFIRAEYDTDASFIYFLASVFYSHLTDGTIVPSEFSEDDRLGPFQRIGCPICHRKHVTNDNASLPANTDHSITRADFYRRWALKE